MQRCEEKYNKGKAVCRLASRSTGRLGSQCATHKHVPIMHPLICSPLPPHTSATRPGPPQRTVCGTRAIDAATPHQVNSILRHVAEIHKLDLEDLYRRTAWVLDKKYGGAGSCFEAFKLAVANSDTVLSGLDLPPDVYKTLLITIRRRMTPQAARIRAGLPDECVRPMRRAVDERVHGVAQKSKCTATATRALMR